MLAEFVTVARRHGSLRLLNTGVNEFDNLAALEAHEMIVVLTLFQLVSRAFGIKMMPNNNACPFKLRQNAINRSEADVASFRNKILVNLFCRDMPTLINALFGSFLEELQNPLTRYGCLKTGIFQFGGLVSRRIVHVSPPFQKCIYPLSYEVDVFSAHTLYCSIYMLAKRISIAALGLAALLSVSGCSTIAETWDNAGNYVPNFIKPFRADVHQGNLVTSEMVTQLEKGMTAAQVQFLLGIPLVRDQFHPKRWDYVYYLLRGDNERQLRKLTVFFNDEGRVDHWLSDPMPDEEQADQMILGTIKTFEPRAPKTEPTAVLQH